MLIKSHAATKKIVGPMEIHEYLINSNFSGALIEINGNHGKIKCIGEDRVYFILEGKGKFIINDIEDEVNSNDLVFIPKNTPYNIIGKLKFFLLCSPEFNSEHDVPL